MDKNRINNKIIALIGLLVLSGALLTIGGCGDNPGAAHLYQLEKHYYEAERTASLVNLDPTRIQEADLLQAADLYGSVIDYFQQHRDLFSDLPGSADDIVRDSLLNDTPLPENFSVRFAAATIAIRSSFRRAAILSITPQYETALEIYRNIPSDYPAMDNYHAMASFELASVYARRGRWEDAVGVYHRLMYEHRIPADTLAAYDIRWIEIPLQIVRSYNLINDNEAAQAWMDTAQAFYDRVIENYQTGTTATIAKTHAASVHRLKGEYREAITRYRSIVDSAGRIVPQAHLEIGNIYVENLNQPDSAMDVFKDLVVQRPDTEPATIAQTKIASILIEQGQYQEARDLLRPLKESYEKRGQLVAGVLLLIGRTYEEEGAWDRALNEYSWLAGNFPDLPQTLNVYLHVMASMVREGNTGIAEQWQRKGREHYADVIARNPDTELAAAAQKNLARSWTILFKWEEAAEAYRTMIDTYPGAPALVDSYIELSAVYADRLNQPQESIAVLEDLLERFPTLSYREQIEERIALLRSKSLIELQNCGNT